MARLITQADREKFTEAIRAYQAEKLAYDAAAVKRVIRIFAVFFLSLITIGVILIFILILSRLF